MRRKARRSVLQFDVFHKPLDSRLKFREVVAGVPVGQVAASDLDAARVVAATKFTGALVVQLAQTREGVR